MRIKGNYSEPETTSQKRTEDRVSKGNGGSINDLARLAPGLRRAKHFIKSKLAKSPVLETSPSAAS